MDPKLDESYTEANSVISEANKALFDIATERKSCSTLHSFLEPRRHAMKASPLVIPSRSSSRIQSRKIFPIMLVPILLNNFLQLSKLSKPTPIYYPIHRFTNINLRLKFSLIKN